MYNLQELSSLPISYKLDSEYFEVGSAYIIRLGTNDFRVGLLIYYKEDSVTFKILEKGEVIDLTLTVDQLRFNNYWLVKMEPDYENGKFQNE